VELEDMGDPIENENDDENENEKKRRLPGE
jgi:hypothetical protein